MNRIQLHKPLDPSIALLVLLFLLIGFGCCPRPITKYLIQPSTSDSGSCGSLLTHFVSGSNQKVEFDFDHLMTLSPGDRVEAILAGDTTAFVLKSFKEESTYTSHAFSIPDDAQGELLLIFRGNLEFMEEGVLIGEIQYKGKSYDLRTCSPGHYRIGEIDLNALTSYNGLSHPRLDSTRLAQDIDVDCGYEEGNGQIDLMVVYTDKARDSAGGQLEIEANIIARIERTNQVFVKNEIPVRFHLNHLSEYKNYDDEVEDSTLSLDYKLKHYLTTDSSLARLRNHVGADLYFVFVQNGTSDYNGYSDESRGMAVIRSSTAKRRLILAHEIGHLLGAVHDSLCTTSQLGNDTMSIMANEDGHYRTDLFTLPGGAYCLPNLLSGVINKARFVSGYRCLSLPPQAVLPDFFLDNGAEPSTQIDTQAYMYSPHLYIRNLLDTNLLHLYQYQNPIPGTPNYLYVMVKNGSPRSIKGSIKSYHYLDPMLNPLWVDLELISTEKNILIPPNATEVVDILIPVSADIPAQTGFVAIFRPSGTLTNLPDFIFDCVVEKNQISARAESILNTPSDPPVSSFSISGFASSPSINTKMKLRPTNQNSLRLRFLPSPETGQDFLVDGGEFTANYLDANELSRSSVFKLRPIPTNNLSRELPLPDIFKDQQGVASIQFELDNFPSGKATYPIQLQLLENGKVIGAYTYKVRTGP